MTATTPEKTSTKPAAVEHLPQQEIDYSCRNPLLFLFTAGVLWLIVSLLTGILASVKMHAPGMFADSAALTYGRVAAVSSNAFFYGFASQVGIGVALWLFARLGKTFLVLPRCGLVAGMIWNLGVVLGLIGILTGGMTQHRLFEMPAWTAMIFFAAFAILGVSGILTFNARNEKEVYPSNWYLLAAFFTFPWLLSVAYLLLGRYTLRGVLEPAISIWYANNFLWLWLGPIALATIYYFVSKLSGRPLHSRSMAVFSFWLYLLFVNALGFQNMPGLPNWLPALSAAMNLLLLIPVAVMRVNWFKTVYPVGRGKKDKEPASRYVRFAIFAFTSAIILSYLISLPSVDEVVGLTVFHHGMTAWIGYGFIGMAFLGALTYILPRLTEIDWPNPKLTAVHYGLTVTGIALVAGAWMLGGVLQGTAINTPSMPFNTIVKRVVPFIGINSIGLLALLVAQLALLGNMALMFKMCAAKCCGWGTKEAAR